jgi:hypothetical protein
MSIGARDDPNSSFYQPKRSGFVDDKAVKMLSTKLHLDTKKKHMEQLDARIKKLQLEEQKALKRINDAKR